MLKKIMDIIYPKKCGFCNIINEEYTCKKCKKKLEYIYTEDKVIKVENKYFDYMISAYFYEDIIRRKILEFKFLNKKYLYKSLSEKLVNDLRGYDKLFDCIVYVPVSLKRYLERGYNQAYLIAMYISKELNKTLVRFGIIKIKNNNKQSKLGMEQRITNVKDVYRVVFKNKIKGKRILLIDDIYTTGATVNECSKVLKEAGAKEIFVATIAKVKSK